MFSLNIISTMFEIIILVGILIQVYITLVASPYVMFILSFVISLCIIRIVQEVNIINALFL